MDINLTSCKNYEEAIKKVRDEAVKNKAWTGGKEITGTWNGCTIKAQTTGFWIFKKTKITISSTAKDTDVPKKELNARKAQGGESISFYYNKGTYKTTKNGNESSDDISEKVKNLFEKSQQLNGHNFQTQSEVSKSQQISQINRNTDAQPPVIQANETPTLTQINEAKTENTEKTKNEEKICGIINEGNKQGHMGASNALTSHKAEILDIIKLGKLDVNMKINNEPLLHYAVNSGDLEIVQALIDARADLNELDNKGHTPLYNAIHEKNNAIAEALINAGANVNEQNSSGNTPLHIAAGSGNVDIVKILIEKEANVSVHGDQNNTPLHKAVGSGNVEIVKILLEKEANVDVQDNWNNTPLYNAADSGNAEIVQILLERGANVNAENKDGNMPLRNAVCKGNVEIVKTLIGAGANINEKDSNGKTPLEIVQKNLEQKKTELQIVQGKLQKAQEKKNAQENTGTDEKIKSPDALVSNYQETVNGYQEKVNDYQKKVDNCQEKVDNCREIIRLLEEADSKKPSQVQQEHPKTSNSVTAEINPAISNTQVETPGLTSEQNLAKFAQLVDNGNNAEAIKMIQDRLIGVNEKDSNGHTPLYYAVNNSNPEIVRFLLKSGAEIDEASRKAIIEKGQSLGYRGADAFVQYQEVDLLLKAADKQESLPVFTDGIKNAWRVYGMMYEHSGMQKNGGVILGLIQSGDLDVNAKMGTIGLTLLHLAARKGSVEIIKALIEKGANINEKDSNGKTPLEIVQDALQEEEKRFNMEQGKLQKAREKKNSQENTETDNKIKELEASIANQQKKVDNCQEIVNLLQEKSNQ